MQIQSAIIGIIALFSINNASAQDRLYKKNGEMEEVKVKEVGTRTIVYKKWNNQEGPDYQIPKGEVARIKFQNGDEEEFGARGAMRPVKEKRISGGKDADTRYGRNILSFSPIHMTNTSVTGFGIAYERMLGKSYNFSFNLPISYSFRNGDRYNYNTNNTDDVSAKVFWLFPGLKFYPSGSDHVVTYAVGPTFAIITGEEPDYNSTLNEYITKDIFLVGLQITNYLNIQPTPNLYIGLQLGLGITYYTQTNNNTDNNSYGYDNKYYKKNSNIPISDFGFRVGYRF